MANKNLENNDLRGLTQELLKINPAEKNTLSSMLEKMKSEPLDDTEKVLLMRIYEKYKTQIDVTNLNVKNALKGLSNNIESAVLTTEMKPLLLYHALEKNIMNRDYFKGNELELKTLNSHFANLINQLQINKYSIGQIFALKGNNDLEKGENLKKMIFSNDANFSETERQYNLGACIMLVKIIDFHRNLIATNDLARIQKLSEEGNPLSDIFENSKGLSSEERNKYFMQITFSELPKLLVTEKMKRAGAIGKRVVGSALDWMKNLPGFPKSDTREESDVEEMWKQTQEGIHEEMQELAEKTLKKIGLTEAEQRTINRDKVVNFIVTEAWISTEGNRPEMRGATPAEKKLLAAILTVEGVDEKTQKIYGIDIHALLDNPSIEKKFFQIWNAHATTQDILMLKSVMSPESGDESMDTKMNEFTLLLYMEHFLDTHNEKSDAGTLIGKIQVKMVKELWSMRDYLEKLMLKDRSAAIAYEEVSAAIDETKKFGSNVKENPALWLLYGVPALFVLFHSYVFVASRVMSWNIRPGIGRKLRLLAFGNKLVMIGDMQYQRDEINKMKSELEKQKLVNEVSVLSEELKALGEKSTGGALDAASDGARINQIRNRLHEISQGLSDSASRVNIQSTLSHLDISSEESKSKFHKAMIELRTHINSGKFNLKARK